jgi:N-acetylmuramoyl-L-alanine amidase
MAATRSRKWPPRRRLLWGLPAALLLLGAGVIGVPTYLNSIAPSGIVIHHSAVPFMTNGPALDVGVLDDIHRRRGYGVFFRGRVYHVGYHYVILPDGSVQQGRPESCRGAHARGYNDHIGICLVGDFGAAAERAADRGPSEPTDAQMNSLVGLCKRLRRDYAIPSQRVIRHRDVDAGTECPGERFSFQEFMRRCEN